MLDPLWPGRGHLSFAHRCSLAPAPRVSIEAVVSDDRRRLRLCHHHLMDVLWILIEYSFNTILLYCIFFDRIVLIHYIFVGIKQFYSMNTIEYSLVRLGHVQLRKLSVISMSGKPSLSHSFPMGFPWFVHVFPQNFFGNVAAPGFWAPLRTAESAEPGWVPKVMGLPVVWFDGCLWGKIFRPQASCRTWTYHLVFSAT